MKALLSNPTTTQLAPMRTALICLVITLLPVSFASAQNDDRAVWSMATEVQQAISDWNYPEARRLLQSLEETFPEHWAVKFAQGRLLFHEGKYPEAVELLRAAEDGAPSSQRSRIRQMMNRVSATAEVVSDYQTHVTPDGLFEIRYQGPRDEVLMPWAEKTLEAAYYEIGYSTGFWPEAPIRVEIYPKAEILARVSSLPLEAVETTSTIGLCKYNKLMFASPRSAVRGYGWRDTLAHEYTHLVISKMTNDRVPVWLHEALAKYLERRWRGEWAMALEPSRDDLLSQRIEADDLVTFDEMHPSIALLPSQEDASVAYAEVFTVIEYLVDRRGHRAIRDLLVAIRDGAEPEEAFAQVAGEPWDVFERNWMSWLKNERPRTDLPGDFEPEIQLAGMGENADETGDEDLAGLENPEARDYLRLGQLLRARDMIEASISEYRKAEAILGSYNPMVQSSMAKALIDLQRYDEALAAVDEVRQWYPSYYLSHLYRGEALNALGRHEEALESFEAAVDVNPFDPRVHEGFADAYEALGRQEEAEQAKAHAQLVGSGS
jgi:tetratricopeptide (TPR) repeat protein